MPFDLAIMLSGTSLSMCTMMNEVFAEALFTLIKDGKQPEGPSREVQPIKCLTIM